MKKQDLITIKYPSNPIIVGKIGGAYGIRGWLKIISFTDKIDDIFHYGPWFVLFKDKWKLMRLECWKVIGKRYIAKIVDISNREFAMLLTQLNLFIDESRLPSLCDGEYYWKDVIGCKVITMQGRMLGYVDHILETIAHDILVIKVNQNNFVKVKDCLIPVVYNKIIKNINLIQNIIIVDWNF